MFYTNFPKVVRLVRKEIVKKKKTKNTKFIYLFFVVELKRQQEFADCRFREQIRSLEAKTPPAVSGK